MSTILTYAIAIAVLIIFLKIISLPFRLIMKFLINSIIGGIILMACQYFGFGIIIYWWTIALTGLFGVPGLIIAVILSFII